MGIFSKRTEDRISRKAKKLYGDSQEWALPYQLRDGAVNAIKGSKQLGQKVFNRTIAPQLHGATPAEYGKAELKRRARNLLIKSAKAASNESRTLLVEPKRRKKR